ncbi:MAG TPA: Gfo/Idh/MocA family oxidoreductase [Candidatus Micrarchaeia archaeon]|nr:Gfo/Idh/MocA family oxidoreductase [Candidatus Micrarchaeia archaeon]
MIRTLVVVSPEREAGLAPWLDYLRHAGASEVVLTTDHDRLLGLTGVDVVVASTSRGPLADEQEAALCAFVRAGGGFVGLNGTTHAWRENRAFVRLLGSEPDGRLPETELLARAADPGHAVVRRLPLPIAVREATASLTRLEPDCEVVLSARWRLHEVPLAYCRSVGRGRVFACGVGASPSTVADPAVQQLLHRALRYAAGVDERGSVGVGLLGYGAIAAEHVAAIAAVPGLRLAAVCDRSPARLAAAAGAAPAAAVHPEPAALLADPAVDLVVVSTPPNTHHQMARAALAAGKHVVVEKPFCLTRRDADDLQTLARAQARVLTVFQNRRWDPDFLAVQQVVGSGRLGEVFHAETFVGGHHHPCNLWHSDADVSGGVIFDWGAHYLDWLLALLPGRVERVSAFAQKRCWHDVTNHDQLRLVMTLTGGVQAEFMHSDIAAARKPKWYLLGTRAALVGHWREEQLCTRTEAGAVAWERLLPTDLPCDLHVLTPDGSGGTHDERLALPAPPPHAFYRNLAGHLLCGEPLAVSPASALRTVAVMEAAMRSAAATGDPVPVDV